MVYYTPCLPARLLDVDDDGGVRRYAWSVEHKTEAPAVRVRSFVRQDSAFTECLYVRHSQCSKCYTSNIEYTPENTLILLLQNRHYFPTFYCTDVGNTVWKASSDAYLLATLAMIQKPRTSYQQARVRNRRDELPQAVAFPDRSNTEIKR